MVKVTVSLMWLSAGRHQRVRARVAFFFWDLLDFFPLCLISLFFLSLRGGICFRMQELCGVCSNSVAAIWRAVHTGGALISSASLSVCLPSKELLVDFTVVAWWWF